MYSRSIADPEAFKADMATEHLDWFKTVGRRRGIRLIR